MPKTSLIIDTAFDVCQVGVWQDETCITMASVPGGGKHDVILPTLVDEIFKVHKIDIKELDEVIVTTGPGRFTGLRVGIAFARGLVLVHKTKLIGVQTTDALRWDLDQAHPNLPHSAIIVTVKRGESFIQRPGQPIDNVTDADLEAYLAQHDLKHVAGVLSSEVIDIVSKKETIQRYEAIVNPSLPAILAVARLQSGVQQDVVRPYYAA